MGITLQTNQREQAGSDVYNRYEYQVHWIVCQIISKLNSNPDCIVFCEYHDDMAELSDPTKDVFEYYQVKTKDDSSEWTVVDLSQKIKRKNGSYKHSFLGFIFYNFMQFGFECARCSFVSNAPMDIEIRTWQACIEDDLILKLEQPELYQKIKTRISEEYGDTKPDNFDDIFERFIQNTFISTDSLQLQTYEAQTRDNFFTYLKDQKMPINTAHLIFDQIITDVRHKSKQTINPPISKKSLILKKGIRISDISALLKSKALRDDVYYAFRAYLNTVGLLDSKIDKIVAGKITHDLRWNNIEDSNYQTCVVIMREIISDYVSRNNNNLDTILQECAQALLAQDLSLTCLDINLIEVLYYERKYANRNDQ